MRCGGLCMWFLSNSLGMFLSRIGKSGWNWLTCDVFSWDTVQIKIEEDPRRDGWIDSVQQDCNMLSIWHLQLKPRPHGDNYCRRSRRQYYYRRCGRAITEARAAAAAECNRTLLQYWQYCIATIAQSMIHDDNNNEFVAHPLKFLNQGPP